MQLLNAAASARQKAARAGHCEEGRKQSVLSEKLYSSGDIPVVGLQQRMIILDKLYTLLFFTEKLYREVPKLLKCRIRPISMQIDDRSISAGSHK